MSQITQFIRTRKAEIAAGGEAGTQDLHLISTRIPTAEWERVKRLTAALKVTRQELLLRLITAALDEAEQAISG